MADETKRMIIKKGTGIPTIPISSDHRNGDWIATDIYDGEFYKDSDTGIVYNRSGVSISPISKSSNITSTVYNVSETSVIDAFQEFTTGALTVPSVLDGEEVKITAVFRNATAPISNGFGAYFFFDNTEYVHPSATTPTYSNSFFQLPFDRTLLWCELIVHRIDSANAYIINKQVLSDNTTLVNPTVYGEEAYASIALNWSNFTDIKIQTFITANGEITLEYLKITKLTA
jgi:hypothetical protein